MYLGSAVRGRFTSIGYAPVDHGLGGFAADGADVADLLLLKGHAAAGQARFFLHLQLAVEVAAPHGLDVAGIGGGQGLHFVHGLGGPGALFAVFEGALVQIAGQVGKQGGDSGGQVVQADEGLFAGVAADQDALVLFQVLGAQLQAQGHALHLPLAELPAGGVVAVVQLDAGVLADGGGHLGGLLGYAGLVGRDRHHHHLPGRNGRGQDQAIVVAVGHDDGAHQTGGDAPAGLEGVVQLVVPAGEGDVVGAAELVAEVVAGAALQGLVLTEVIFYANRSPVVNIKSSCR